MGIIKQWKFTLLVSALYVPWVYYWAFSDGARRNLPMDRMDGSYLYVWAIMLYGAVIAAVACWIDKVPIKSR